MKVVFENTDVWGFEGAIRGMRNPFNSHNKSDSEYQQANFCDSSFVIGEADMKLAKSLITSGDEHGKLLRMIHVQTDITIPRAIWSELDTYKFSTKNSQSTMHKLLNNKNEITLAQFDYDAADFALWGKIIERLEYLRQEYRKDNSTPAYRNNLLVRAKMLLPEGFLQMRTWDTNYQELRRIYFQRKGHRMPHWEEVRDWIETLPYSELITCTKEDIHD